MLTSIQISNRYDPAVIKATTPIIGPDAWGVGPGDDAGTLMIVFDEGRLNEVMAAIDGYDDYILARAKSDRIEAVATRRKNAIIHGFSFNGMSMKLDPDTENALSKAYAALQRQPQGTAIDWEVSRGVFMSFDLSTVGAISDAAFGHVQACFTNSKAITAQIVAAEDMLALDALDLDSGWA